MALWNNTDAEASRPNWINLALLPTGTQLLFIDTAEAAVASNQARGIKGPGWWLSREYKDSDNQTRYKTELVVAMGVDPVVAGDNDTVPDVLTTLSISTQPVDALSVAGAASFTVVAAVTPAGAVTYQWQRKAVGTTRWVSVVGETADTIALTGQEEANSGDQYRVQVASAGAVALTSTPAALIFGD